MRTPTRFRPVVSGCVRDGVRGGDVEHQIGDRVDDRCPGNVPLHHIAVEEIDPKAADAENDKHDADHIAVEPRHLAEEVGDVAEDREHRREGDCCDSQPDHVIGRSIVGTAHKRENWLAVVDVCDTDARADRQEQNDCRTGPLQFSRQFRRTRCRLRRDIVGLFYPVTIGR